MSSLETILAQLQAQNWQAAISTCQQLIEQEPNAWYYHHLGKAWIGQGNLETAIQAFQTALDQNPDLCWSHYELSRCLMQQGKLPAAMTAVQRSLDLNPDFCWAYDVLAELYLAQNQTGAAIEAYRKAIELDPQEASFQVKLGHALERHTQLSTILDKLLRLDPDLQQVFGGAESLGASHDLIALLNRQVQLGDHTLETGAGLTTLLFALKGTIHHCIVPDAKLVDRIQTYGQQHHISMQTVTFHVDRSEHILPALQLEPLDLVLIAGRQAFPSPLIDWYYTTNWLKVGGLSMIADAQLWAGESLKQFLNLESEWELVAEVPTESPTSAIFRKLQDGSHDKSWFQQPYVVQQCLQRLSRAIAYVEQSRWQEAVVVCQHAIPLEATNPWLYKTLADAYIGQGLWRQAIEACQKAIALDSNISWFHDTLAKAYLGQGQWQEAIAACQQAIQKDSEVSWFYYHLGEAQVKSGHWAAAIPNLKRSIELDADFPWSYHYLGEALLAQADVEAAIEVYQQATQNHPEIDYLRSCLDYAKHLSSQEQRIHTYCQQVQQKPRQGLRILMLTPYPTYPPKLGAIARMFHEMQVLGATHELVVMSFIFSKADYVLETELAHYCDLGLTVMVGDAPPRQPQQPALIHRYSSDRMRTLLQLLKPANFDIILCDFIYMSQYIDLFPDAFHILSEHNIESSLLRRCAIVQQNPSQLQQIAHQSAAVKAFLDSDREADLLAAFEQEYWPKFPLRWVVSEQDRQEMATRCPQGQTLVVNNGIDTQTIRPIAPSNSRKILFIGTMSYYPNIDGASYFVEQILPIVWQQDPTVQFCIAGADPPQVILDFATDQRITVIANPEDMSSVAQDCMLTIVPLRIGSGTRIKILHSMAMGLPVVSTTLGCEGLNVTDGEHLLIRDQPQAFAEAILQLMTDQTLRQQLSQQGRTLVEHHYDWQQIFTQAEKEMVKALQTWREQQIK